MASSQQLREWLIKMQYSNPYPSEEALQILCKGALGPIFHQIIERVKPRQDVQNVKKSILVNRLLNDTKNLCNDSDDIPQIKIYNENRKLEKELNQLEASNLENEANLQHLISKIKSKNAKLQLLKYKLQETLKDNVLLKAKTVELDKQIEICQNLLEQINLLQIGSTSTENLTDKFNPIFTEIEQVISKFDRQLVPPIQEKPIIEESLNYLDTSVILSSNKKPLSTSKRSKRANSTKRNIFDVSSNFSLAVPKGNFSKTSIHSFNNTLISSSSHNNHDEVMKNLEEIVWNNLPIQKQVEDIWHFGPQEVFKLLNELQLQHKKKIINMIADNSNSAFDAVSNFNSNTTVYGLEKLYSFHIQTKLKKLKCDQQQQTVTKMIDTHLNDIIKDVTVLESTEYGLISSMSHLRQSISKMQQDFSDNSIKLEQILNEIKDIQTEMETTKCKIETNLCLLYDCNTWIKKLQSNVLVNKEHQFYTEFDLFQRNTAEEDVQAFLLCPFQQNNLHYFDSWNRIYSTPELFEVFQCPFLSPESSIRLHSTQKRWLNQLRSIERNEATLNTNRSITATANPFNFNSFNNSYKESLSKLKLAEDKCRETLLLLTDFNAELKYNLEAPLNNCVAKKLKHDDKTLQEYIEIYESYYKQL